MSVNFQSSDIEPVIRCNSCVIPFILTWLEFKASSALPCLTDPCGILQCSMSSDYQRISPSTWKNMEAHQRYQDVCAAIAGSLRVSPFDGFLPCPHQRQVLQLLARLQLQEPETRWNKVHCMEPIGAIREKMGKGFKSNDENWGGISRKGMRRRRTTARGW